MKRKRIFGFSLVELLVVLVILGLVSSMALPNLVRAYASLSFNSDLETVKMSLSSLGHRAFLANQSIEVTSGVELSEWIQPPEGWILTVIEPLVVRSNGFCIGGAISVANGNTSKTLRITAPHCSVSDV